MSSLFPDAYFPMQAAVGSSPWPAKGPSTTASYERKSQQYGQQGSFRRRNLVIGKREAESLAPNSWRATKWVPPAAFLPATTNTGACPRTLPPKKRGGHCWPPGRLSKKETTTYWCICWLPLLRLPKTSNTVVIPLGSVILIQAASLVPGSPASVNTHCALYPSVPL